jgi:hypothetical protein
MPAASESGGWGIGVRMSREVRATGQLATSRTLGAGASTVPKPGLKDIQKAE